MFGAFEWVHRPYYTLFFHHKGKLSYIFLLVVCEYFLHTITIVW